MATEKYLRKSGTPLEKEADRLTSVYGREHQPSWDLKEVAPVEPESFLFDWATHRQEAAERIALKYRSDIHLLAYDFFIDGKPLGGISLSQSQMVQLTTGYCLSVIASLHDAGIDWDTMIEKVFRKITDAPASIYTRQIELLCALSQQESCGRKFKDSLTASSRELASYLQENGVNVTGIFVAGSAAFVDPENPLRIIHAMQQLHKALDLTSDDLEESKLSKNLFDVDLVIFVSSEKDMDKIAQLEIQKRVWGKRFYPFGYQTDTVYRKFPDAIGLDIGISTKRELIKAIRRVGKGQPDYTHKAPCTLVRHPDILKPSSTLLDYGIVTEAYPVWWPNNSKVKRIFHKALQRLYKQSDLEQLLDLIRAGLINQRTQVLYSDPVMQDCLRERWDKGRRGIFIS